MHACLKQIEKQCAKLSVLQITCSKGLPMLLWQSWMHSVWKLGLKTNGCNQDVPIVCTINKSLLNLKMLWIKLKFHSEILWVINTLTTKCYVKLVDFYFLLQRFITSTMKWVIIVSKMLILQFHIIYWRYVISQMLHGKTVVSEKLCNLLDEFDKTPFRLSLPYSLYWVRL